jgi:CheY-like chemotaxis protein
MDGVSPPPVIFLVIDFNAESRYLLVKTLRRKFPTAVIHETEDADNAEQIVRSGAVTAVISHRTFDVEGVDLVRRLRAADRDVPIVMVSGIDRGTAPMDAGADAFLHYDQWLRIGTLVERLVGVGANDGGAGAAT